MPRLLRLAKCQGYASFACGCGGILCPTLQRSPAGDSTLMTSAPKSDKITAALGPAMKLAKSTTFRPEKILSFGMVFLFFSLKAHLVCFTDRGIAGRVFRGRLTCLLFCLPLPRRGRNRKPPATSLRSG